MIFHEYDDDESGELDASELRDALRGLGIYLKTEQFQRFWRVLDLNKDGAVSEEEFCAFFENTDYEHAGGERILVSKPEFKNLTMADTREAEELRHDGEEDQQGRYGRVLNTVEPFPHPHHKPSKYHHNRAHSPRHTPKHRKKGGHAKGAISTADF